MAAAHPHPAEPPRARRLPTTSWLAAAGTLARHARLLATMIPALVAIAIFLPSLGNGFAYDDVITIVDNRTLQQLSTLPRVASQPYWPSEGLHYRPLTMLGYGLQWSAGGGAPWLFHAVSVLLHALVTVLVVRVALRWTSPVGATAAGLLFAVHPVHVEVVANVVGQAEMAAAAALLGLVLLVMRGGPATRERLYTVAALSAIALASKETGLAAPAVVWVAARLRLDAAASWKGWVGASAAGILFVLVLRLVVLDSLIGDRAHVLWLTTPRLEATLFALALLPQAVALAVTPQLPRPEYVPPSREIVQPEWVLVALGITLIAGLAILALRHLRRPGLVTFGVLYAGATFALVSNVVIHTGVVLAERSLYSPSVGAALLLGAGVGLAWRARRWTMLAVAAIWPVAAVPLTLGAIPIWRSTASVSAAMRERAPESYTGWLDEAMVRAWRGDVAGADTMYDVALARFDRDPELLALAGENALRRGKPARATLLLDSAVVLQPDHYRARTASAYLALRRGDAAHAQRLLRDGLAIHPDQRRWRVLLDSLEGQEEERKEGSMHSAAQRLGPRR